MTRLLVSVRNLAEAQVALECGVDLIDLKEPARGALGSVDRAEAERVAVWLQGRVPLSLALGELREAPNGATLPEAAMRHVAFAKLGLARCASHSAWQSEWLRWAERLPSSTAPVAVVYADAATVEAPTAGAVLEAAAKSRCRAVLVDTAVKDGRTLFDHWPPEALRRFADEVRAWNLLCVAGGSLELDSIPKAAACGVDYVAVRGAACEGSRTGSLSRAKLEAIRRLVTLLPAA